MSFYPYHWRLKYIRLQIFVYFIYPNCLLCNFVQYFFFLIQLVAILEKGYLLEKILLIRKRNKNFNDNWIEKWMKTRITYLNSITLIYNKNINH